MSNVKIVPYSLDLKDAHVAFASKHWKKKRRLDAHYILWKFRATANMPVHSFILAIDEDTQKVIGQLGVVPCSVHIFGNVLSAQWACDLLVDPTYRGKGIAQKLYDYTHQQKDITLGSDPSPLAAASMTKKGYKSLQGPFKFFFARNLDEILKVKKIHIGIAKHIPNPLFFMFKIGRLIIKPSFSEINTATYKERKRSQLSSLSKPYVVFDDSFVNWRFAAFTPYYEGISTFGKANGSFFSGFFKGGVFYLTDYGVKNIFEFLGILFYIVTNHRKFKRIRFYSNYKTFTTWLPFFGCIKFRTPTEIIYFTNNGTMELTSFYYTSHDSDENI